MYRLTRHAVLTDADGGAIVLDTRRGTYWQLNSTALWILRHLEEGASPEDAARRIAEDTGACPGTVARDVGAVVRQLLAAGILERSR